jgi:hypothetical protein
MKRSFSIRPHDELARFAGQTRRATGNARVVGLVAALILTSTVSSVFAQMELNNVTFQPPTSKDPSLRASFFLQQTNIGTSADWVTHVTVKANGAPIDSSNVVFTKAIDLPNYSCAILLLVDNTLGNRPGIDQKTKDQLHAAVRNSLTNFLSAGKAPYNLEIATISDGNCRPRASMGSDNKMLAAAISEINFDGGSPQLYLELKEAVRMFSQIAADRKFIVVFSDGFSNDQEKVASAADVVSAAQKANIHICSIGFPTATGSNVTQSLEPLAEQTGGGWVEAAISRPTSSSQPSPSGHTRSPAQTQSLKFELPHGVEDTLLKLATSGGQVQVKLAGLTAPVNLVFSIESQLNHLYTFSYNLDSIPAAPTPTPPSNPTPAPVTSATPAPAAGSPSLVDTVKLWFIKNAVVASAIAAAAVAVLVLLLLLIRRALSPAVSEPSEPNEATQPIETVPIPEPSALAWLESLDSDQNRYPINKSAVRIGRRPDNDIVMKNDTVSGHHAEILVRGSEFVIADLGASNPVFVGGKQVQKALLQNGDIIELGEVRLRFLQPQPEANPDYRTKVIS